MLCAHTVRRLKPGSFEEFRTTFGPPEDAPDGWVRFHMLRDLADPDRVVTFGFFDGSLEELERSQADHGYRDLREATAKLVDEVVSNGVYEIVETRLVEAAHR
jgi:quinol monooxygenase YgiN